MSLPLFPNLIPRIVDSAWFNVDQPCDDENEVAELEHDHQAWVRCMETFSSKQTYFILMILAQFYSTKEHGSSTYWKKYHGGDFFTSLFIYSLLLNATCNSILADIGR